MKTIQELVDAHFASIKSYNIYMYALKFGEYKSRIWASQSNPSFVWISVLQTLKGMLVFVFFLKQVLGDACLCFKENDNE